MYCFMVTLESVCGGTGSRQLQALWSPMVPAGDEENQEQDGFGN